MNSYSHNCLSMNTHVQYAVFVNTHRKRAIIQLFATENQIQTATATALTTTKTLKSTPYMSKMIKRNKYYDIRQQPAITFTSNTRAKSSTHTQIQYSHPFNYMCRSTHSGSDKIKHNKSLQRHGMPYYRIYIYTYISRVPEVKTATTQPY